MAEVITTIKMDRDLTEELDRICRELGMSINTAVTIFAKRTVRKQGLPFPVELDPMDKRLAYRKALKELREDASKIPDMTMEEIDEMISEYRASNP